MKFYKIIFFLVIIFSSHQVSAQESITAQLNLPLLDKYIALAKLNYPKLEMYKASEESAKGKVGVARATYFDAFTASYFYRPENSSIINTTNPYAINGFQLGVNLNLGILFRTPAFVRQAKGELKMYEFQTKEYEILLETEVKEKYFEYIKFSTDYKIKVKAFVDNKTTSDGLKYKFEKGEASLDIYSKALSLTSYSSSEKLEAELEMLKSKERLEAIIGDKLESVK